MRKTSLLSAGAAALLVAACAEPTTTNGLLTRAALSGALVTAPAGYGELSTSYVGDRAAAAGDSAGWVGGGRERRMGGGSMMGGGLADAYLGAIGFGGFGGHRGPFGGGVACTGTFAAGRVECAPETLRNGLTVTRSAAYSDAAGSVQQAFDTLTTNTVNMRVAVAGSFTFQAPESLRGDSLGRARGQHGPGGRGGRGGNCPPGMQILGDTSRILEATTTIANSSERTVSGLAQGSTQRTVNGASEGHETTTGTSSRGAFTATRTVGDTTVGLVIPVSTDGRAYPTAGTVTRSIAATLTYGGESPITVTRREVVTYDGSATAKVEITQDGTTRSCTRALPRGPLTCQ